MEITIMAVHIDTGAQDDLVLLAPQITQTIRGCLAQPANVRSGALAPLTIAAPVPAPAERAEVPAAEQTPAPKPATRTFNAKKDTCTCGRTKWAKAKLCVVCAKQEVQRHGRKAA